jgi:hypothetical protein
MFLSAARKSFFHSQVGFYRVRLHAVNITQPPTGILTDNWQGT